MALSENVIKLVGFLAWPITTILACILFYGPLSRLAGRITKFSAFKVDVELRALSQAVSLNATLDRLKKVPVTESGIAPIVAGVIKSGSADYLLVNIGDAGDQWLTSRIFLLAAILERSHTVRCMVFLDAADHFVGAALPKDIRSSIGAQYLAYETAFAAAYGTLPPDQNMFRSGLNETLINYLSSAFLRSSSISRNYMAVEGGWVELQHGGASPPTWEFADWVTAASLKNLLGHYLLRGSVIADIGRISPQTTKAIVRLTGPFVALVDNDQVFREICDRHAVLESIAREAIEQSTEPPG